MSTADDLLADLASRGIELKAEGGRLRFRPAAFMTPDLAGRMKEHKPELLALLTGGSEPPAGGRPETHADREWRRFLRVCKPWPNGRGWYDPVEMRLLEQGYVRRGRIPSHPGAVL